MIGHMLQTPCRRDYGVSQRFWSKVVKTNRSYTLSCHGNGTHPLYGNYTVTYATKAGTFDHDTSSNCVLVHSVPPFIEK